MFRVKSTRRNLKRASPDAGTVAATVSTAATGAAAAGTTAAPVSIPIPIPTDIPTVLTVTTATTATAATAATVAKPSGSSSSSNTVEFFAAESAATALTKPWLRLERGLRLQRFRAYAEAYPGLSTAEKTRLYEVLVAANDKKLLNTKQQVTYENGVIQSIRGLKVIRTGDAAEPAVIKIEPPQLTKRNTKDV